MAPGQQSSRRLGDELREQRARLLARAALLEADVGALLAPAVDAINLGQIFLEASCVSVIGTSPSESGLRDVPMQTMTTTARTETPR